MLLLGKRVFHLKLIKYMFVCIFAGFSATSLADEVDFLAYGDLRGYLEPCGCDPATDLGGILRINSQLMRERLSAPNLLSFNLGNNLSDKRRDAIKNRYLIKGEEVNAPTAYLINELELQNLEFLKTSKLPFVLTNTRVAPVGRPFIETSEMIVMGYTWSDIHAKSLTRVDAKLILEWQNNLKKIAGKKSVLLFSGPDEDLKKFADAKLFSSIISSNKRPLTEIPGKEESENDSLLLRLKNPAVFMVPLGGQGILRSGNLTMSEAKTIDGLFKAPTKDCNDQKGVTAITLGSDCSSGSKLFGKGFSRFTWLKKPTEAGHGLAAFYTSFNKEIADQFKSEGLGRIAALKDSPFAGSTLCAQCHDSAHKVYTQTRHAHAMQTLISKGKHEDAECVACHSVGSDKAGGFVSIKDSPQFANVQCENCHGPRKDHTLNPSIKSAAGSAKQACATCHNRQHSPNFNLNTYWEKIKH